VVLRPGHSRGRHALARGAPAAQRGAADLGARRPGQPARRGAGPAQADPQGAAPRLQRLRSLGAAREIPAVQPPGDRLPWRTLMGAIRSLGYLRIEATDTGAWREFGTRMLGMVEGRGPEPGAIYLRMDDFPARLVIVPGQTDRLLASGWEVATEADLVALGQAVDRLGVAIKTGSPEEPQSRRGAGLLRFEDASGHTLEVFCGASLDNRRAFSAYGCRFVTGELGMGHVVIPAADDEAAMAFYNGALGFRLRDTMSMPPELFGRPAGGPP